MTIFCVLIHFIHNLRITKLFSLKFHILAFHQLEMINTKENCYLVRKNISWKIITFRKYRNERKLSHAFQNSSSFSSHKKITCFVLFHRMALNIMELITYSFLVINFGFFIFFKILWKLMSFLRFIFQQQRNIKGTFLLGI